MERGNGYEWKEPIRQQAWFDVIDCEIERQEGSSKLSRLQKWVCKVFKIVPENKYWYLVRVRTKSMLVVKPTYVLSDEQGNY